MLARLSKQEQRDEAAQRTDRGREEHELRIVVLQDFVTAEEHAMPPSFDKTFENLSWL